MRRLVGAVLAETEDVWSDVLPAQKNIRYVAPTLVLFEQTRQFATSVGPLAADAVVITILPLVLVLATGKWLARGLAEGVRP